mgnify:FL=1
MDQHGKLQAEAYNVFELFDRQWALVTAGSIEHYNSCTVGWGSLGNLWGPTGRSRPTVTVYVHPARYTCEFLEQGDTFTVSFYPPEYRRALGYIARTPAETAIKPPQPD